MFLRPILTIASVRNTGETGEFICVMSSHKCDATEFLRSCLLIGLAYSSLTNFVMLFSTLVIFLAKFLFFSKATKMEPTKMCFIKFRICIKSTKFKTGLESVLFVLKTSSKVFRQQKTEHLNF